jgi:hypothetical protein
MEKLLDFSYDWNNKLSNKAFTTIRLYNPDKYKVGQVFNVRLNEKFIFQAIVMDAKKLRIEDLNQWVCLLDTGYEVQETKNILLRMYKNVNWEFQFLHYVLLKKI